MTHWKKVDGRNLLFVCSNPEITVSSTGGGNSVGLQSDTVSLTVRFATPVAQVRDERRNKDLGDGDSFTVNWKRNEAVVLSYNAR
jgi:hypothetical protein